MDQRRQDLTSTPWWRAPAARRIVALVVGVAVGMGAAWVLVDDAAPRRDDSPSSGDDRRDLLAAWRRAERTIATVDGTFRREIEGSDPIIDPFVVVQRPPDRIVLGFGSWDGVVGGRSVHCTRDGRDGEFRGCAWGDGATVPSEADEVARLTGGDRPTYRATRLDDGCFALRVVGGNLPVAYGRRTRVCFDDRTGALVRRRVQHERGVDETVADRVVGTVDPADLPTPP